MSEFYYLRKISKMTLVNNWPHVNSDNPFLIAMTLSVTCSGLQYFRQWVGGSEGILGPFGFHFHISRTVFINTKSDSQSL